MLLASRIPLDLRRGGSLASALVALALLSALASCKGPTNPPGGTLSGDVTLAPGQTGNVSPIAVSMYMNDPFAIGATPARTVVATGSATQAHYSFPDIAHGDFYVVAWKDNGDNVVGSGDLRGWYDGAVDGGGQPVAGSIHLLHGQSGVMNIAVSAIP
jgi:hypothetical protein